jgi:hypothetical protein
MVTLSGNSWQFSWWQKFVQLCFKLHVRCEPLSQLSVFLGFDFGCAFCFTLIHNDATYHVLSFVTESSSTITFHCAPVDLCAVKLERHTVSTSRGEVSQ